MKRSRRAPPPTPPTRSRNPLVFGSAAVIVVIVVAAAAWLVASRPSTTAPLATNVTPVALPTFGSGQPQNVLESAAPEILTPTPGVAGPTPQVVTQSPWKVLIAHSAMPDMTPA